jgi:hypothetical protein
MQVEAFVVDVQVTEKGRDRAHERRMTRINQREGHKIRNKFGPANCAFRQEII